MRKLQLPRAQKDLSWSTQAGHFVDGLYASVPIAVGYLPIAITFGLVARTAGLPAYIIILMSLIVFAGASQFVAANLIALGTNCWEIVLTTFILNLRHLLMSASLSQRIEAASKKKLAWLAFGITDESFTVASLRSEKTLPAQFVLGLNLLAYLAWVGGTCIGVSLVKGIPQAWQASMGIALYAMFIGLIVPALRKSRRVLLVVIIALLINSGLHYGPAAHSISMGWKIVITTISTALLAAFIFPQEVNEA